MQAAFTLNDVEAHYERTVDYDEINDRTPSHMKRFIDGLKMSSIKDGAKVLNVFCRSGKGEEYYSKHRKNLEFSSMDVSRRLLKEAKKRLEAAGVKAKLFHYTSERLPFRDGSFDNAISYETLEHVPEPGKLILEFSRVLKKGGELVLSTPNTSWDWIHSLVAVLGIHHPEGPHRMVPRKEIIAMLHEAGFTIIREKTVILMPVGPKSLIAASEVIENLIGEHLRRYLCLRRYFVGIKV